MIGQQEYAAAWGEDNIFEYPRNEWIREFRAAPDSYPDVDIIPTDLSVAFTCYFEESRFGIYDLINLRVSDDEYVPLLIIGAVPADPDSALFCFDANNGSVVLLAAETGGRELVNSSFKLFAQFLYHFALFIDADTGIDGRAKRAMELSKTLRLIDDSAFSNPASWRAVVLAQLGAPV